MSVVRVDARLDVQSRATLLMGAESDHTFFDNRIEAVGTNMIPGRCELRPSPPCELGLSTLEAHPSFPSSHSESSDENLHASWQVLRQLHWGSASERACSGCVSRASSWCLPLAFCGCWPRAFSGCCLRASCNSCGPTLAAWGLGPRDRLRCSLGLQVLDPECPQRWAPPQAVTDRRADLGNVHRQLLEQELLELLEQPHERH